MSFIPDRMTTGQAVLFSIVVVIVCLLLAMVAIGLAFCVIGIAAA